MERRGSDEKFTAKPSLRNAGFLPSFLPSFVYSSRVAIPSLSRFKPRFRFHARSCLSTRLSLPIIERFGLMGFHYPFPGTDNSSLLLLVYLWGSCEKRIVFYTNLCRKIHRGKKKSFDRMIRTKILITRRHSFQFFQLRA